jgi:hypothetical protein
MLQVELQLQVALRKRVEMEFRQVVAQVNLVVQVETELLVAAVVDLQALALVALVAME